MSYELFSRVALTEDMPEHSLRRGDVATIVESHHSQRGHEIGYTLEVFNAPGETMAAITVRNLRLSR